MSKKTYNVDVKSLMQLPANVYLLNTECRILELNSSAASLFNLSPEECIGLDYDDMTKIGNWVNGQAKTYQSSALDVMQKNQTQSGTIEPVLPHPDGRIRSYISTRIPLSNKNKKVVGVLGISVEINKISYMENTSLKIDPISAFTKKIINSHENTYKLSTQQLECLFWLAKGMTLKKIAFSMKLSHRTIESYIENIKLKLNCNSKTDLIEHALKIPEIQNRLF